MIVVTVSRCGSPAFTARMPHSPLAGLGVDSESNFERRKIHESREIKAGALRRCIQDPALKVCQATNEGCTRKRWLLPDSTGRCRTTGMNKFFKLNGRYWDEHLACVRTTASPWVCVPERGRSPTLHSPARFVLHYRGQKKVSKSAG